MSLLSPNLCAFLAVARRGTVHAAARELHLTQTGVTQRVRSLEKQLQTTLFLRSRMGMKLSAEGQALFRYCQGAESLEGQTLSQIGAAGLAAYQSVPLVGPTSVLTARVAVACIPLYQAWPQLHLNFIVRDKNDRLEWLRSGQASLAIVAPHEIGREMEGKPLKPERYVLVASKKWKGRRLQDILETERILDFDADDSTTLNYLKKFGLSEKIGRPRLYMNSNEVLIQMLLAGVGFATLTQEIAKPHLDTGHLILLNGGASYDSPLALAWYPRPQMPKYFRAILDAIK